MRSKNGRNRDVVLASLPVVGSILFVLFYILAAMNYPGGYNGNLHSSGFSWMHNYWCDLTGAAAKNGLVNTARPYALAGLAVLCFTHSVFWFYVPMLFADFAYTRLVRMTGVSAMLIAGFHFIAWHDLIIDFASLLSASALIAVFLGLYHRGWMLLFYGGLFFLLLMILDFILYVTPGGDAWLPVLQKITFLVFLIWVVAVNAKILRFIRQQKEET